MGLGRSFSHFHRHCLYPCSHSWLPPLCIPESNLSRPPGSIHFMPFTPQATNLSFNLLPSLKEYTSCSARRELPCLPHLRCQFLPARVPFVPPPSAPSLPPNISFYRFLLSLYCFIFSPSESVLPVLHSFSTNPPMWFIAVLCNSALTYFSWLRCTGIPHSNII